MCSNVGQVTEREVGPGVRCYRRLQVDWNLNAGNVICFDESASFQIVRAKPQKTGGHVVPVRLHGAAVSHLARLADYQDRPQPAQSFSKFEGIVCRSGSDVACAGAVGLCRLPTRVNIFCSYERQVNDTVLTVPLGAVELSVRVSLRSCEKV